MNAPATISEEALPTGRYVQAGDVRLHLHDVGQGDRVVVFLHGSGPGASGWSNFDANARVLAAAGFRCLLPDLLGWGRSDKPTDRPYTMEVIGTALLAALDTLGVREVTLVGNSMGGALAIWLARHHAQRVEALVLMAPGGLEDRETYMGMKGIRSLARCLYGPEGLTREGMHLLFGKQVFDSALTPHDVIDLRYEVARTQPLHVFQSLAVPNQADHLGEITCPVLTLWGMDDQFCPVSGARTIAERVPRGRVVLLGRCGHWVMVEHQAVFDRYLLDFLRHG
ncbi:MAG: alpha/beta fold hydrolase [Alphaproteobacteria bacterium]|nr:alpha/beta fold hydrolase [Alphaproteobacteria bacterium]